MPRAKDELRVAPWENPRTKETGTHFRMALQCGGRIGSQTNESFDNFFFVIRGSSQELRPEPLRCQNLLYLVRFSINFTPQFSERLRIWLPQPTALYSSATCRYRDKDVLPKVRAECGMIR